MNTILNFSGARLMTVSHSCGNHSRLAFWFGLRARSIPIAGLLGIFPRFTALVNIEESAVIILSANVGHLSATQRSRTS